MANLLTVFARMRNRVPASDDRRVFRAPSTVYWLLAVVGVFLFFHSPQAHAQTPEYNWVIGYTGQGADCVSNGPSQSNTTCASAAASCKSIAGIYGQTEYYLFPSPIPSSGNTGVSCAWFYNFDYVQGLSVGVPTGTAADGNAPPGNSPPGGVQSPKQIGGGCDCSKSDPSKDTKDEPSNTGSIMRGEPININSGNMSYQVTDYTTAGQNPLKFTRYYNSRGAFLGPLGVNWRSTYDRYIWIYSSTAVAVQRQDGQTFNFTLSGGVWSSDSDVDYTLTNSGTTWTLTTPDDTVETYVTYNPTYEATLRSIALRNGYTQTLTYGTRTQLSSVTDSYGRTLTFGYNSTGVITSIANPDSQTINYGYNASSDGNLLTTVTFPSSQTITYVYGNPTLPSTLTGVQDENSATYLSWTYDAYGRALTSQVGNGSTANITTVSYNDSTGARTVTNALGESETFTFTTLQGVPKLTGISRASTATTTAATRTFTYDSNGYMASATDWNGNSTTFANNSHGLPTTINEAVGSSPSVARTTTITYDTTWVRLPKTVVTPGVTIDYTFDTSGEVLTKKFTDTTTTSVPYSTNGQTRTWTYTYSNHLLATVQTPRTDVTAVTTFGYGTDGALTSVTDPYSHVTSVTSHTGGGLPLTVVDPNSVTTMFTYDGRQRLTTSAITTSGGVRTATYTVDPTGELTKILLADNTSISYSFDAAHRKTQMADGYNNPMQYTLDAMGDVTQTKGLFNGTQVYNHTGTFDALGRTLTDVGGAGQTRTLAYDNNGNVLTFKDGLNQTTTRVFDALNRLTTSTDANSAVAQWTYDPHDRPLTVQDQNGHSTSYVYDGFGDVIQEASPDRGTTVYHYDNNGNMTSKTDALAVVTNQTFDKLDRVLTTAYPADTTLNVAYTYDQTGTGFAFGVGRLTSVTDKAGSLTRTYDERGNLITEARVNSGNTYTITYGYNSAGRQSSVTTPDGTRVSSSYDLPGAVFIMRAKPAGASTTTTIASNINHLPFGPIQYIAYGNGNTETWFQDLDYRTYSLTANAGPITSTTLMLFNYGYDAADNLTGITDLLHSSNSQTMTYDVLNRLHTAVSGTGGYGSYTYGFDAGGNLSSLQIGTTTTTYGYASGTNRLSTINSSSVSTNANGNITAIPVALGGSNATFTYNKANRLSAESGGGISTAVTSIVYDAFGRRFSKAYTTGSPTLYFYDQQGNVIAENNGGTYTDYGYVDNIPIVVINPTASPSTNIITYVSTDRLGVPQMIADTTGASVWTNSYTPFGQGGLPISSIVNDRRLPGQMYDAETGFHYNLNRDYMPNIGRYLEADPIGLQGGLNPYRYANGRPFSVIDPTGLEGSNIINTLVNKGGEKAAETGLSKYLQSNGMSKTNADDFAKVCIDTTTYVLEHGADTNPYALILDLLGEQAKDEFEEQLKEKVLNDPDVKALENRSMSEGNSMGHSINDWINNLPPLRQIHNAFKP